MSSDVTTRPARLTRQYAKLCELPDFHDQELVRWIADVLPAEPVADKPRRKAWEFGMVGSFLNDVGALDDSTTVLDVAAGTEPLLYWLTNRSGQVTAVDIYGSGHFAEMEAQGGMLDDPGRFAPYPYREDRLDVRYMDARKLDFPDESFDVVVTCSSIEHFGTMRQIAGAASEIGRVLKPGGHAFIITELFVKHSLIDRAPVHFAARLATLGKRAPTATPWRRYALNEMFTRRELQRYVIDASGLRLMQPIDYSVSDDTWTNVTITHPGGRYTTTTGAEFPHILLQGGRSVFTSVCLPLEKAA
jgi:SAM-dependent methyltransferase